MPDELLTPHMVWQRGQRYPYFVWWANVPVFIGQFPRFHECLQYTGWVFTKRIFLFSIFHTKRSIASNNNNANTIRFLSAFDLLSFLGIDFFKHTFKVLDIRTQRFNNQTMISNLFSFTENHIAIITGVVFFHRNGLTLALG